MTAAVSRLPIEDAEPAPAMPRSVYLDAYLAPLRPWLERETVTEIIVNRPGELWIEDAEQPGMQRIAAVPDMPNFIKGVINLRGQIIPVMDVVSSLSLSA